MSIQQQEQIKSLLYRLAELKRIVDAQAERLAALEAKEAERKKTLGLNKP